jgi:hypothetical protein
MCVISLAEQDEEALRDFKEKKGAVDSRTKDLQRKKLHPQLKDDNLSDTMDSLSHTKGDYSHLSVADQRLMNLMPLSRHENFTGSGVRESFYNVRILVFQCCAIFHLWLVPSVSYPHPL